MRRRRCRVGIGGYRARAAAGLSQRRLAATAGLAQATLSRIVAGSRTPTVPELVAIADATGTTLSALTGEGVEARVHCVARATNGSEMAAMRSALLHCLELDAYLDDQGIPARP
ncbi:helix-turn-helix transcriptional regulator [Pseudonocardia kongjuensis]|uniref:helix-turn-helix domain-containing protein n=1 Tax=Pseudonocardia kongjuensis TaxID=102227 RepID=UPI0031DD597F